MKVLKLADTVCFPSARSSSKYFYALTYFNLYNNPTVTTIPIVKMKKLRHKEVIPR